MRLGQFLGKRRPDRSINSLSGCDTEKRAHAAFTLFAINNILISGVVPRR